MKGYKGMKSDMTCRGMKYEIGKTYQAEGEIELCRNGLHFCINLYDVFRFYELGRSNRYFEVEASGAIVQGDDKSAASELTIIRELSQIEVNRAKYGNSYGYGNGNGDGYGYGYGNSYGNDYGNGYGNGYGDGYGYGYGNGNGYCDGSNIQQYLIWR